MKVLFLHICYQIRMKFNIINIDKVVSTNSYAQQLLESGDLHDGDVISTRFQESGRGQGNNFWESEPDSNLLISIILEPHMISASQQFVLTQLVSFAIADIVKEFVPQDSELLKAKIKWPNDIYIGNKKVAGVLFQNFIKGNKIEYSIVGIGINVNQKKFYSEAPNPVSIINYTNEQIDLDELLNKLLEKVGKNYEEYRIEKNFPILKSMYINDLYRFNSWATYSDKRNEFRGKIIDIDDFGRLLIESQNGEVKTFMFKEVEFLDF